MRRIAMVLGFVGGILAGPAAALPLSDWPSDLALLDPGGVLSGVQVYVCGREPYDSYFLQVSMAEGTMAVADALTAQFGKALGAALGTEVDPDPARWPEAMKQLPRDDASRDQMDALRHLGGQLEAMVPLMVRSTGQMPSLVSQGPGLLTRLPQDFTGLRGRLRMVSVANALRHSAGQMERAVVSSRRTLDNLRAIVAALPK